MSARRMRSRYLWIAALVVVGWGCGSAALEGDVVTWRVPEGGRLPRTLIDESGLVHLVYVVGDPRRGDLMHATRRLGETSWSPPERVNSELGTVTGIGPIDGGQLALGREGRLHVAWFSISPIEFFYTRTEEGGGGFEPQFGVAAGSGVEAGPSIAADDGGNVFLFWHAGDVEDADRRVYLTVSRDDGATFEPARPVNAEPEGACACCSLHAVSDLGGRLYVSYRGAGDNVHRGQRLLTSTDAGGSFSDQLIQPWELGACPVSTTTLADGPTGITVAWETQGQVHFAAVTDLDRVTTPPGQADTRRKNPIVATNERGETLLAWGDGSGFRSGGALHWQVFDADGQPTPEHSTGAMVVPEGSVPSVLATSEGTFLVIF